MPYWFDGNNLIGLSAAAARADRKTRKSFLELLSAYARARGGRFTVFFDGDDTDRILPPGGVRVRYSAPLSTDDAILEMAQGASARSEITVVTNDRGLSSRCRAQGTKTMDWRQFTTRMDSTRGKPGTPAQKEERVDVEEWSRYFGIDPRKLK